MATTGKSIANVLKNPIAPAFLAKEGETSKTTIGGYAYNVALEVVVESIVRYFAKAKRNVMDMTATHALSQAFHGGLMPWAGAYNSDGTWPDAVKDGAKGIPAVLAARYCVEVFHSGFFMPKFNFKELMITAGSKTATRPVSKMIKKWLPKTITDQATVIDALYNRQMEVSNLNMKK